MPADLQKARELFLHAVGKLPPEQWESYVAEACGGDVELAQQVGRLLKVHREAGSFLDQPAVPLRASGDLDQAANGAAATTAQEGPGTTIGPYKLLELIGEGGMGAIWMAEQSEPMQRKVALKIIKAGMDTSQVVARFEAERQALALMDHPNIAKVFDGGTTAGGRPYFVMELVKGVPITRYCDELRLTPRERLELFLPVCQAIQHAHQKGIIHRDVKPSNVLVAPYDGRPVPKVIDFGVAKATGQRLSERTLFTGFGAVVGTLEYMSPEQAELNNRDIDTRSDIYSLGVLLYELLTGTTPLTRERRTHAAFTEMLRFIREEEPPRPSTRLSDSKDSLPSISAQRHMEPARLTKLVRGELDWIVMKALDKDRNRRYETANGFADDVERYLKDESVQACPPSAGYRLRKFLRRNKRAALAIGTVLVLLIIGVVGTSIGLIRAIAAEKKASAALQRADEEARTAKAVSAFLQKDLLGLADIGKQPSLFRGGAGRNPNVTVRELLDRAAENIEGEFGDQPLTEAALRLTIGDAYEALSRYPEAQDHLERSVQLRADHLGADHPDTLISKYRLAVVYHQRSRYAQATPLILEVVAARSTRLGPDHPDTLTSKKELAELYEELGKHEMAVQLYEEVLRARTARLGPDHPDTLESKSNQAKLYMDQRQFARAAELYEEVLRVRTARLGPDHPDTLTSKNDQIELYIQQGRFAEAERLAQEVLRFRMQKLPPDHLDTLVSKYDLAHVYLSQGNYLKAEPLYLEAVRASTAKLGADHMFTLYCKNSLGMLYEYQGEYAKAEEMYQQELKASMSVNGSNHPTTLTAKNNLASLYDDQGQYRRAEPWYLGAFQGDLAIFGPEHSFTLLNKANLAVLNMNLGRYTRAEQLFRELLQTQTALLGVDHLDTLLTKHYLAAFYKEVGRYAEAEAMFLEVQKAREAKLPADHPFTLTTKNSLAELYLAQGLLAKAEPLFQEVLKAREAKLPANHPDLLITRHDIASLCYKQGHLARAEVLFLEVLKACTAKLAADHPGTLMTKDNLAKLYLSQGQHAKAEPLALAVVKSQITNLDAGHPRTLAGLQQLVRLYDAWGKKDQAKEWQKKLNEAKTAANSAAKN